MLLPRRQTRQSPFAITLYEHRAATVAISRYPFELEPCRRLVENVTNPAIVHVDGTARYQVLRRSENADLYDLIEAFAKCTGVPMLLNTSLNRAGEPIVVPY